MSSSVLPLRTNFFLLDIWTVVPLFNQTLQPDDSQSQITELWSYWLERLNENQLLLCHNWNVHRSHDTFRIVWNVNRPLDNWPWQSANWMCSQCEKCQRVWHSANRHVISLDERRPICRWEIATDHSSVFVVASIPAYFLPKSFFGPVTFFSIRTSPTKIVCFLLLRQ